LKQAVKGRPVALTIRTGSLEHVGDVRPRASLIAVSPLGPAPTIYQRGYRNCKQNQAGSSCISNSRPAIDTRQKRFPRWPNNRRRYAPASGHIAHSVDTVSGRTGRVPSNGRSRTDGKPWGGGGGGGEMALPSST